jgi:hypothetical protein
MPLPTRVDLTTGVLSAAAVTVELAVAGLVEAGSAWAPFNAVAPLLLPPETAEARGWDPEVTPVGLAITVAGITGWAALHSCVFRTLVPEADRSRTTAAGAGALSAMALLCFDYCLLPPSRRPRFARRLSPAAIAAKYAALGLILTLRTASLTASSRPE